MTRVSVIIPAFNQARYLAGSIQSVLEQTHADFELIVVDDGSTDGTRDVVNHFSDARLQYIYQENQGLSAARNSGIQNSAAPYLTFLDSDDLFLHEKLEVLSSILDSDPALGFVAGKAIPVDESGREVGAIFDTPIPEDPVRLLLGNPLHVGSVMLRRQWQEKVGNFDESLRSYEDWDMWLRLVRAGCPMSWVNKAVSLYRFHTAQMTRIGEQMTTASFAVLDKIYADPKLPQNWQQLRRQAYSNAYLRAAAQAYLASDYCLAQENLKQAVDLDPDLVSDEAISLANIIRSWVDLPKIKDSLRFLDEVYSNLPENLAVLKKRKKPDLGQAAMQFAFEAFGRGEYKAARSNAWQGFGYQPSWLLHRGALAMYLRATISQLRSSTPTKSGERNKFHDIR